MVFRKGEIKALSNWYFTKKNVGWKVGIRICKWSNNKNIQIQILRVRTNKLRKWVPTKNEFFMSVPDFMELFEPVNGKVKDLLGDLGEVIEE